MSDSIKTYDVFLSHGSPDKPWVRALHAKLTAAGLTAYLDEVNIAAGDNFVCNLSNGIGGTSTFVIVVSNGTMERPWVEHEWTSFMATHGPRNRIIPILLDDVVLPPFLRPFQAIRALDRNVDPVVSRIGRALGKEVSHRATEHYTGQALTFTLAPVDGEKIGVTSTDGSIRIVLPPWLDGNKFSLALMDFRKMTRAAAEDEKSRGHLNAAAQIVGAGLFDLLISDEDLVRNFDRATAAGPRAVLTVRSDDDALLALPWELIVREGRFLVRDGILDVVRTTAGDVQFETLLAPPQKPFTLVTNVSAPEGSGLSYEAESFRITHALTDHCEQTTTELGTLDDLIETVRTAQPTGIHFSGHGAPGALVFESDEGYEDKVPIDRLVTAMRRSEGGGLPPFFFLASCHGNTPARPESGEPGSWSSAARLHREGVTEVVGFFGPIADELSTRAEEALYAAISRGETTRTAVAAARSALLRALGDVDASHRPVASDNMAAREAASDRNVTHPFAWAQLVFYHRGPENPLGTPASMHRLRQKEAALKRTFRDPQTRAYLEDGFIGRRREQHLLRRRKKRGDRVFVLQGLGGLGKTTLAGRLLPTLADEKQTLTFWCRETEGATDQAEALVGRLLAHCRARYGAGWEAVVSHVDRVAGDDSTARFMMFLQILLEQDKGLPTAIYFDNMESLLNGPEEVSLTRAPDADVFGSWRSENLTKLWRALVEFAEASGNLFLVASCRYRNEDLEDHLVTVAPMDGSDTLRLMAWFPSLRRLSMRSRVRLTERLSGHPRAVQFADDLLKASIRTYERRNGEWKAPNSQDTAATEREWADLIAPVLPKVETRIWSDLLLDAIWENILDDPARRMLFRISLLRRPFEEDLIACLGEEDGTADDARRSAAVLGSTSLLEDCERIVPTSSGSVRRRHLTVHASTASFAIMKFPNASELIRTSHRRIGTYFETEARTSLAIYIEAGHHLFEADEYDRAYELLGSASDFLTQRGRSREALSLLIPFRSAQVRTEMRHDQVSRLLGTLGLAYDNLGETRRAIEHYEQSLMMAREFGNRYVEGNALGNLGLAYANLGETRRAIEQFELALVIAREIGDHRGERSALSSLGLAYTALGETRRAIDHHEQHLMIAREFRDRYGEGNALGNLGLAYAAMGETRRAIEHHEQHLVIAREIGDRRGEGNALGNLGLAYAALGETDRAIEHYEHVLAIMREIGDRRGEGTTLGNLGNAYAILGETRRAVEHYGQSLSIGREISDPRIVAVCEEGLKRIRDEGESAATD